ncbi:hypothetical protein NL676_001849 [Syzygium grande]|nr:hypothetical protein NL676_001849 [Syzygium grande]
MEDGRGAQVISDGIDERWRRGMTETACERRVMGDAASALATGGRKALVGHQVRVQRPSPDLGEALHGLADRRRGGLAMKALAQESRGPAQGLPRLAGRGRGLCGYPGGL